MVGSDMTDSFTLNNSVQYNTFILFQAIAWRYRDFLVFVTVDVLLKIWPLRHTIDETIEQTELVQAAGRECLQHHHHVVHAVVRERNLL